MVGIAGSQFLHRSTLDHGSRSARPDLGRLMDRIAEGDRESFVELFDATVDPLFDDVCTVLSEDAAAGVVVQSFVELWRLARHHAHDPREPMGWLRRIVARRVMETRHENAAPPEVSAAAAIPPTVLADIRIGTAAVELARMLGRYPAGAAGPLDPQVMVAALIARLPAPLDDDGDSSGDLDPHDATARPAVERLAEVMADTADRISGEQDPLDGLQLLVEGISGAVGATVGILLRDRRGALQSMVTSTQSAALFELLQTPQGPSLDAYSAAEVIADADLNSAATRWPSFARAAADAGYRSVHAFPLRLGGEAVGALTLLRPDPGPVLDAAATMLVRALADLAALMFLPGRTIRQGQYLAYQLHGVLTDRIVLEQAKGIVAERYGTSIGEAFTMLWSYARRGDHRLRDVAHLIVVDPTTIPDLSMVSSAGHLPVTTVDRR